MFESNADVSAVYFNQNIANAISKVSGWDSGATTWQWPSRSGPYKDLLATEGEGKTQAVLKL